MSIFYYVGMILVLTWTNLLLAKILYALEQIKYRMDDINDKM